MLVVDAVRMVIGKLFQIRGAVELNARPANTVLSVGWDSSWWSDGDVVILAQIVTHSSRRETFCPILCRFAVNRLTIIISCSKKAAL